MGYLRCTFLGVGFSAARDPFWVVEDSRVWTFVQCGAALGLTRVKGLGVSFGLRFKLEGSDDW